MLGESDHAVTEMYYCDDATNEIWLGINPRGCYIDLKRLSDGFTLEKVHAVGYIINHQKWKSSYRNKTPHIKYQYKGVFNKIKIPDPVN